MIVDVNYCKANMNFCKQYFSSWAAQRFLSLAFYVDVALCLSLSLWSQLIWAFVYLFSDWFSSFFVPMKTLLKILILRLVWHLIFLNLFFEHFWTSSDSSQSYKISINLYPLKIRRMFSSSRKKKTQEVNSQFNSILLQLKPFCLKKHQKLQGIS